MVISKISKFKKRQSKLPFPNRPCFSLVCGTSLLKTPWREKKLLITSNSPFPGAFHPFGELLIFIKFKTVVCKFLNFGGVQNLLFGKGLRTVGEYGPRFFFSWSQRHTRKCDLPWYDWNNVERRKQQSIDPQVKKVSAKWSTVTKYYTYLDIMRHGKLQ